MQQMSETEMQELRTLMLKATKPHLRTKATALWNLGRGKTRYQVADVLGVSMVSITAWAQRYRAEGVAGLGVHPGRGRKGQAVLSEVEYYLRQSPRAFGLAQTRWTLRSLAQVVPSLHGFTDMGVWKVLNRAGFRYKRGQPHLHSPDPLYEEKRGLWTRPSVTPPPIQER